MSDRFFVESPVSGDSAVLTGQEATHLTRVLRARVGDCVQLFDGSGDEFTARITRIRKDAVECELLVRRTVDRELPCCLALGVALPKGDRQRLLVEKLTELGVASLTPLITERSVVQPDDAAVNRLRRAVKEASKQCGRNRLMAVHSPSRLPQFLAAADPASLRVLAHPRAPSAAEIVLQANGPLPTLGDRSEVEPLTLESLVSRTLPNVTMAVGPEGGFSDSELATAWAAGWLQMELGPRILRVETAAMVLAAVAAVAPRHDRYREGSSG